ncbi:serine-rich adhesin for platelets-like [Penaeus chinensis]|uniref:serine-rich adhesin for platelets-like n=1 Tax=Penaeus chinensis TaxID=139456 RepID=UPI001FB72133|nr:serine-rich adhesin for platelets-like [Penaeus chinensis]
MDGLNEEGEGLPEVYLSPSRQYRTDRNSGPTPNDSDQNVWEDIEGETWVPLRPKPANDETITRLDNDHQATYSLGMREEIEGISSLESSAAGSSTVTNASQSHALSMSEVKEPERMPEGAGNHEDGSSHLLNAETKVKNIAKGVVAWSRQRGETPGSDCPPVAGAGALPRTFRQNLKLDTNYSSQQSSELVFSPGGDEGFMVPGGVHAYYGSGSDTEGLEWSMGEEYQADSVAPYRDVVEGADSVTPVPQNYSGNGSSVGLRAMERNSPAGLSTPDADVDVTVAVARSLSSRKSKNSIRPPVVGQSEELLVQASRKDLGSTDGEESEEGGAKRPPIRDDLFSAPETQPGSLGSQSENTDSVNTVLDMSRGEVQGCETEAVGTPMLSTPLTLEPTMSQPHHKPNFVIGGPISPRGKFRQFQNTVRGRMQDVKASLEIQPGLNLGVHVDREQFLSQPPLYAPTTPVCEQEVSLASMISVETNHPDSSDRVTSPSVLSVSSAASSKRLEWDSGADVGYAGNTPEQMTTSLSTLERIAIGNYASVLRTEPEGTTQVKEKLKNSKKSYKACGAKGGGSLLSVKRNIPEVVGSLPSRSLRVPQIRERKLLSSSDEEFDSRRTSPSQSPRRKPRRRSSLAVAKDNDIQAKRNSGVQLTHGRIREIMGEINNEGKSSSLVELNQTNKNTVECRRSNSQQSLSVTNAEKEDDANIVSRMNSTYVRSGPVATGISRSTVANIFANTSTSTSTLVQSMSPLPVQGIYASTSSTLVEGASQACSRSELVTNKSSDEEVYSSQSSIHQLKDKVGLINLQRRTCVSSGNDISSKSQESSDLETPSDMKDTDIDSCNSLQLSDDMPVNLKAKKNSRNARNHGNISRPTGSISEPRCKSKDSKSGTNILAEKGHKEVQDSSESFLESRLSLQSSNNSLQALSAKLKKRIQVLLDQGTMKKVQDFNKLQDYIEFIGIPSTNEEECRLKHGVAGVITRMFGEIEADDTDTSNTFNSETSETPTTDSHASENITQSHSNTDFPSVDENQPTEEPGSFPCKSTTEKDEGQERSVTPGGTITLRAYRPPSASRTYFMAVSRECDEGLVEGERTATPESGSSSLQVFGQEIDFHRGQAEGQREDTESGIPSLSPRFWQQVDRSYPGTGDGIRKDGTSTPNMQDRGIIGEEIANENENEDDSRSFSESATLPPDWGLGLRRSQAVSSGAVTSDECSPRHVGRWSVLDRRSSWHEEDMNGRFRNTDDWKTATTRSERLYKDRRGTLHVANQPPGYMDDRDSHPSESTSEHEHHQRRSNDTESHDDGRRGAARPWTSSGSESAYETIRERHRHVDEALASSFEFYSTSPRDARLLGYMSSDAAKDEEADEADEPVQDESQADQILSAASSEQLSTGRPVHSKKRVLRQQHTEEQNSTPSSHTDANDVSSQVSFIQLQKQKYVKRIQRHIHTLEKLERALMEQLGDSIGSENSFRRCVTEGRSQTESDTNIRSQTRDILGQSETATSSIISSDYSDEVMEKCNRLKRRMKANSCHSMSSESQAGQESRSQSSGKKSESTKSATGFNSLGQSYMSSPRFAQSQMGSDLASSRASTLKRIEKEVKKLAITEEKSRQAFPKGQRKPSAKSSLKEGIHLQNAMRKMPREEPRGEEGPKKSQDKSTREISDDNLSVQALKIGGSTPDDGRHLTDKRSKIQKGKTELISDKQSTDQTISDSPFLRQGDGREARDGNQKIKMPAVLYKKDNGRLRVDSPPVRDIPRLDTKKITNLHDFGQMFPSVESFLSDDDNRHSCSEDGRSVGIQTGESLLCLAKSPVDTTKSHHSKTVDILHQKDVRKSESKMRERDQTKDKQASRPSSGNGREKHENIQRKNDVIDTKDRHLKKQIDPQEGESEDQPLLLKQITRRGQVGHKDKALLSSAPSSRPDSGGETERQSSNGKSREKQKFNEDPKTDRQSSNGKSREKQKFNEDPKTSSRQVIGDSHPSYRMDKFEDNISSCREDAKKHFSDGTTTRYQRTESSRQEININKDKQLSSRPVSARAESKQRMALDVDVSDDMKSNMQLERSGNQTESSLSSRHDLNDDSGKEYSGPSDQRHGYIGNKEHQKERQGNWKSSSEESLIVLRDKTQSSPSQVSSAQRGDSNQLRSYHDQSFHSEYGIPLPVVNNYVRDKQEIKDNQESFAMKGMRKQQRNSQQNEECRKPIQFDVSVGNKENYPRKETPARNLIIAPPVTPLVEKPRKDMTLQEALARARPGYVQGADDRRAMIRLKQEMRRDAQNHNHKVVAQLPTNLQTPSTLQRFLYKPDIAPIFSYKDIRKQNQRIYQLLPEASHPGVKQYRKAQSQTNRLMAGLYSQKLKKKVLKGQVSHAHKDILTPPSHCYKR